MSGRLIVTPYNAEQEIGQTVIQERQLRTGFNLAPASTLSIVRTNLENQLILTDAFWGFTPSWIKQLDLAPYLLRSDKLASSKMYQDSWQHKRCLLIVTGYYVWFASERGKHPFALRLPHNRPFFLAGLWTNYPVSSHKSYDTFGLVSVEADPWLQRFSSRVPLKLSPNQALDWLNPQASTQQLEQLLQTQDTHLEAYPVSHLVNDPANQSDAVIQPVAQRLSRPK